MLTRRKSCLARYVGSKFALSFSPFLLQLLRTLLHILELLLRLFLGLFVGVTPLLMKRVECVDVLSEGCEDWVSLDVVLLCPASLARRHRKVIVRIEIARATVTGHAALLAHCFQNFCHQICVFNPSRPPM